MAFVTDAPGFGLSPTYMPHVHSQGGREDRMTQEDPPLARGATERVSTLNRLAGPLANAVAYRHPKRGKAHDIVIPLDPQPDPWDQAYSGLTACGFRLRWAFPAALAVTAPEDRCRICWREATS